eukprot:SAG31_NODE_578_length_13949_cov_5.041372_11_plen_114_part_00
MLIRLSAIHPASKQEDDQSNDGNVTRRYFTVIGNMCKIATVIINVLAFDEQASGYGLASLAACLFAGCLYEQVSLLLVACESLMTRRQVNARERLSERMCWIGTDTKSGLNSY